MASRLTLLLCLSLCVACARTTFKDSVADQYGAADETSEMDFWDGLVAKPAVTNNDALHALVVSFGEGDAAEGTSNWNSRVDVARQRGWLVQASGNQRRSMSPQKKRVSCGNIIEACCQASNMSSGATSGKRWARWCLNRSFGRSGL